MQTLALTVLTTLQSAFNHTKWDQ